MNDDGKYIKLFGLIMATVIGFLLTLLLIFFVIRLLFGMVNGISWISYFYSLLVLSVPPAIIISAFMILLWRTRTHAYGIARLLSYILISACLFSWITVFVTDVIAFFQKPGYDVMDYNSWGLLFIAGSVGTLFLVGILQALSTPREEDWLERHNRLHP